MKKKWVMVETLVCDYCHGLKLHGCRKWCPTNKAAALRAKSGEKKS